MSAFRQQEELPVGFTRLGNLATVRISDASRLLIPLAVREAIETKQATLPFDSGALPTTVADIQRPADVPAGKLVDKPHEKESLATDSAKTGRMRIRANAGRVQIFSPEALEKAQRELDEIDSDQQKRSRPLLDSAAGNDGFRLLPRIQPALKKLRAAQGEFENLREPIAKLMVDLTLAGAMQAQDFRIRPILLAGDPGVGKTHFALQLAEALNVPMQKWAAANAQANFQLVGSAPDWRQAKPGMIVDLLAKGQSASPVFVLDEVDKISGDGNYPVIPALLELLEAGTARTCRDEYFRMEFDASRIIFVLTANDLDCVPAPLLSRMEVFDVPVPEPAQRLRIIRREVERLCRKTRRRIELDPAGAETLAERIDIDLRQMHRLVVDAFALALVDGKRIAALKVPARTGRRAIGFVM